MGDLSADWAGLARVRGDWRWAVVFHTARNFLEGLGRRLLVCGLSATGGAGLIRVTKRGVAHGNVGLS